MFADAARSLGVAIASQGHRLVYGGGHVGLMGVVADAVLGDNGAVTGVMTEQLVAAEVAHHGVTELEIAPTMHARKARMAELSDGVIVLPGGFGTLDEAFEMITWNQLGLVAVPVVFLDVAGYFGALFEFIEASVSAEFVSAANASLARRASTVDDAVRLAVSTPEAFTPKWLA